MYTIDMYSIDFIPSAELRDGLDQDRLCPLVQAMQRVFDHEGLDRADALVQRVLKNQATIRPKFYHLPEIARFVDEYCAERDDFMRGPSAELLRLLKKYPTIILELLERGQRKFFKNLPQHTQIDIFLTGYYEYTANDRDVAYFNGKQHYRIHQSIHGDSFLSGIPYRPDTQ